MAEEQLPEQEQTVLEAENNKPTPETPAGEVEATEAESPSENTDDEPEESAEAEPSKLARLKNWYLTHKKKTIPATILLVLLIVFSVPWSRYALLGLVLKKDYIAYVTDSKSNLPVSEVEISYKGKTAKTGADGKARLEKVPVGPGQLTASKKYYTDFSGQATVPLRSKTDFKVSLDPTGRQVPIKAVNKINGKPVAGAVLKVAETQVKTDEKGEATVVLPPENETLEGVLTTPAYNEQKVTVKVSHLAVKDNTYELVPAGKLYFLSKRTGKINVMKADLDGTNSSVVLEATGKESETETVLLASRDWQYLALKSRREGADAKLYLIETSNDKLTEIDGGPGATIELVGWSGHQLLYRVLRNKQLWESKQTAFKTYNAEKKQLTTIEETAGEGTNNADYLHSAMQGITILGDRVVYTTLWYSGYLSTDKLNGRKHAITSVKPDGSGKQTLKEFDAATVSYLNSLQSEVDEIYYRINTDTGISFYTYEGGKISEDKDMNDEKFNQAYPTFLVSPTSENTFWFESRDGKNSLIVGNGAGKNGNEIAALSEYTPYGWFSDEYVLISKASSELFIMPSNGVGTTGKVIKITDYHKPATSFYGYGYGYGGF